MKKLISVLTAATLAAGTATALVGCGGEGPRDEILKLYMPGEYIDEDIFEDFEEWYAEKTDGKKIKVVLETFETVENIQRAVEKNKADYDLLLPSDYMVEYLIANDLVKPIDKDFVNIESEGLFKSQYVDSTREFDTQLKYSVPYMYGTLGLVYDVTKTGKHITSWEALFGSEFAGKRSLKKSIRDAYAAACIYNAREELSGLSGQKQKNAIQKVFEDTSEATVKAAENALGAVIKGGAIWDVDDVKFKMAASTTDVAVALMWSCDAGYVMNDYEDDNGDEQHGNRNLWYVVPEEGGNVYIDAFVISKYAKNVTAANYFLQFVCQKEIAIRNSEYAGCISPVAAAYDELYDYYNDDEDGIFDDAPEGWKEMFIETMFPSEETLNRCGIMKDLGDGKTAVTDMWGKIQ
ncbi:MAG: ABC transporter substrate-binding protein [Clostridia bacterium]|nr:ABC transporter substrate-binding protein [Clostridia bacterium]